MPDQTELRNPGPLVTPASRGTEMNRGESIRVVHPLFPVEGGGSIPTSPLQLHVGEISVRQAIALNRLWHSRLPEVIQGNIDRNRHRICFGAEFGGTFYACAIWSSPVAGDLLTKGEFWLELRRYAIADDAPRNTATRMLAVMVKAIRKRFPEVSRLISYQDTEVHAGTIYKAAGWANGKTVTDTNWGLRRSPTGRTRNAVIAAGTKIRWELICRPMDRTAPDGVTQTKGD